VVEFVGRTQQSEKPRLHVDCAETCITGVSFKSGSKARARGCSVGRRRRRRRRRHCCCCCCCCEGVREGLQAFKTKAEYQFYECVLFIVESSTELQLQPFQGVSAV
jgi:hypothetical protein